MKRIIALLLTLASLLLAACGKGLPSEGTGTAEKTVQTAESKESDNRRVPSPMTAPDYTFDHEPSVDEMRAMAVKAMRDMLTIQWFPEKTVRYNKTGAVSNKNFEFFAERYYMGFPYTSAGMGIFQFLAYYDSETGCMNYTNQGTFNESVGNSCASSACWGLLSVCSSIGGNCVSNYLTISNGFYPLGGVTYDSSITDFAEYFTARIVKDNGEAKVLAGYAAVQPGDLLVYSDNSEGRGHTRMAIEKPEVVYKDGAVDPGASTVVVQEQAAKDNEDTSSGITMIRSGETSRRYTFRELLNEGYIAVTTAEFLGQKAYEKCQVSYEGATETLDDLNAGIVRCNYPMAVLRIMLHSDEGDVMLKRTLFSRNDIGDGSAREFSLASAFNNLSNDRRLPNSGTYTVTVEVTASTGETFIPAAVTITK